MKLFIYKRNLINLILAKVSNIRNNKTNFYNFILLFIYVVVWIVLAINPYDRKDWLLENLLLIPTVLLLIFTYKEFKFSSFSYILITLFLILHTIGAHNSYMVPLYDNLFKGNRGLLYDRLVHFSYGFLLWKPVREVLSRYSNMNLKWSSVISIVIILATGAFYEIMEMRVAIFIKGDLAKLFLGDADGWDSQQDMEVALFGAILACLIAFSMKLFKSKK